jgi:HD superfamily phosphohydrolase
MFFLNKSKIYKDVIHGIVTTTILAQSIIDTKIFNRLRYLKQLGCMHFVFPSTNHTRFEHSIGTYYLTGVLLENIIKNSSTSEINNSIIKIPYIKNYILNNLDLDETEENIKDIINNKKNLLDEYLVELIKIAGLCHDLGHGPYSHLFDDWLEEQISLKNNLFIHHEYRSTYLLNTIINSTYIYDDIGKFKLSKLINTDACDFISDLINPSKYSPTCFIYQIISNKLNGLDVDKLDYLTRDCYYLGKSTSFELNRILSNILVINDNINFPEKISYDIYQIFRTRYDMHKQFYGHKVVICINIMIKSIFSKLNIFLNIINNFENNNLDIFMELNDTYILSFSSIYKQLHPNYKINNNIQNFDKDINNFINIMEIDKIINNLNIRKIYKCIYQKSFYDNDIIDLEKILKELNLKNNNNIIIKTYNIGLGGNKNLFEKIYFYNKNKNSIILNNDDISHIISSFSQEKILFIIKKNI